ncbi:MAG: hypothetical protein AAF715_24705 [Myxococcota bacterium]
MTIRRRRAQPSDRGLLALAAGVVFLGCQDPTQVTVQVSTKDIGCGDGPAEVNSTVFRAGSTADELAVEGERWSSLVPTLACEPQPPEGARIGDMAYVPSGADDARFSVEVFLGLNGKSAEACAEECGEDCIRASRRLGFVPQQQLLARIEADIRCRNVCCKEGQTCEGGLCVSDDGCGEGNCGGGGGVGGGGERERQLVGAFPVSDLMVPYLVGTVRSGVGSAKQESFVAAWRDRRAPLPPENEWRCRSEDGDVLVQAVTSSPDGVYLVGHWTGTAPLVCGGQIALSPLAGTNTNAFAIGRGESRTEVVHLFGWSEDVDPANTTGGSIRIEDLSLTSLLGPQQTGSKPHIVVVGSSDAVPFVGAPGTFGADGSLPPVWAASIPLGDGGAVEPQGASIRELAGETGEVRRMATSAVGDNEAVVVASIAPNGDAAPKLLAWRFIEAEGSQVAASVNEISGEVSNLWVQWFQRPSSELRLLLGMVASDGPVTLLPEEGNAEPLLTTGKCGVVSFAANAAEVFGGAAVEFEDDCDGIISTSTPSPFQARGPDVTRSDQGWTVRDPFDILLPPEVVDAVSVFRFDEPGQVWLGGTASADLNPGLSGATQVRRCDTDDAVHPWPAPSGAWPFLLCVNGI